MLGWKALSYAFLWPDTPKRNIPILCNNVHKPVSIHFAVTNIHMYAAANEVVLCSTI